MARDAKLQEYVSYIPVAFDEREKFVAGDNQNPITVEMRCLTAKEIREYERQVVTKVRQDGQVTQPNAGAVDRKLFAESIRSIKNYSVNGEQITTGELLFDKGEIDVAREIRDALLHGAKLEAGRLDLLTSQSAG